VIPSGPGRRLPSRFALIGGLLVALIAPGIAAVVLLVDPKAAHHPNVVSSTRTFTVPATAFEHSAGSSQAKHSTSVAHRSHSDRASTTSAAHGAAPGAAATAGAHRLVAETRDPEEANSYPAPASVHHSAAKTPEAAGEIQVAAGAASDAEVRSELAKMKAIESAANKPSRMATVPGGNSIVGDDGAIAIPSDVPEVIQRVIAGANAIANFPYVYGGGHASFVDNAYDCSGSVSYALAAGGLLSTPETSGQLESWGAPGPGKWITVYANAGHTYMYVNVGGGWMLYDTAGRSGVFASRWQPYPVDNAGYVARHWPGL
jgi:cell wall-associated NlpC family hydrolase